MKRNLLFAALLTVSTFTFVAMAKFKSIGASEISFQAKGPAGLAINGKGSGVEATEAGDKIKFVGDLTKFKTGIGLRDKHLRKMIGNPGKAELTIDKGAVKKPDDKKVGKGEVKGQLKMNGKTKPVTVKYQVKRTGSDYHVQGLFDIDYTDFYEEQCYMGVCVDKQVKVKVNVKLRDS